MAGPNLLPFTALLFLSSGTAALLVGFTWHGHWKLLAGPWTALIIQNFLFLFQRYFNGVKGCRHFWFIGTSALLFGYHLLLTVISISAGPLILAFRIRFDSPLGDQPPDVAYFIILFVIANATQCLCLHRLLRWATEPSEYEGEGDVECGPIRLPPDLPLPHCGQFLMPPAYNDAPPPYVDQEPSYSTIPHGPTNINSLTGQT